MGHKRILVRNVSLFLSCLVWLQGCCGTEHVEPSYPSDVDGWKDYKIGTTKFRGNFVLREGDSTDNGKIKVKVLNLLAPECTGDSGDFSARARVRLQFSKVPDGSELCSDVFPENGGGNLPISDEFGIFGVGVRGINLREKWVYFVLSGDY